MIVIMSEQSWHQTLPSPGCIDFGAHLSALCARLDYIGRQPPIPNPDEDWRRDMSIRSKAAALTLDLGGRAVEQLRDWRASGTDPSSYTTMQTLEIVPVQREAYYYALRELLREDDRVLDVGFGTGYGLDILNGRAASTSGIDVDPAAVENARKGVLAKSPKVESIDLYEGDRLPYESESFDVVTSVDVAEHVPDYLSFLVELLRVSRRAVFISTPNRRPEFTRRDGSPKNHYHLREWSSTELRGILDLLNCRVEMIFINGSWAGPFEVSSRESDSTMALAAVLRPAAT